MKESKVFIVDELVKNFKEYECFYIVNIFSIPVNDTNSFRKKCFEKNVVFEVVKNSLIKKALEKSGIAAKTIESLESQLKLCSGLLFVKEDYKVPAELIFDFQKKCEKNQLVLKCAYVAGELFCGNDSLKVLKNMKSRKELIANIVYSLNYGIRQVMSSLKGVNYKIYGIVKNIAERS